MATTCFFCGRTHIPHPTHPPPPSPHLPPSRPLRGVAVGSARARRSAAQRCGRGGGRWHRPAPSVRRAGGPVGAYSARSARDSRLYEPQTKIKHFVTSFSAIRPVGTTRRLKPPILPFSIHIIIIIISFFFFLQVHNPFQRTEKKYFRRLSQIFLFFFLTLIYILQS